MRRVFFLLLVLSSCSQNHILVGDWEARGSAGDYAEFAIYDNFIQIYSDIAESIPSWDYEIVGDSLRTPILNYKIDWIKKDSLVLRNERFTIQLRRIESGVCLSEVEGNPEDYQPFITSYYDRRGQ